MVESTLELRLVWLQHHYSSPHIMLVFSYFKFILNLGDVLGGDYSTTSILAKVSDTETEFWQMCTFATRTIERACLSQHKSIQPSENSFSLIPQGEGVASFVDIKGHALFFWLHLWRPVLCTWIILCVGLGGAPMEHQRNGLLADVESWEANLGPWGFPGGTVVKNPPANAGYTGSSPGPGRSHMPQSN